MKPPLPLLILALAPSCSAWTFLSNTLGNNMVLQRAPASAMVFGNSNTSGATITITMGTQKFTTTAGNEGAEKGVWRQKLPPIPASLDGVNMTFASSSGETATLTGVLFGDVYLCGGQAPRLLPPITSIAPLRALLIAVQHGVCPRR